MLICITPLYTRTRTASILARTTRWKRCALTLLSTTIFIAYFAINSSPTSALSDEDWDSCVHAAEIVPDRSIRGCTAVIQAGERMITQLAAAYNNRGVALRSSGDIDRAMEDYDRALRLSPDYYVALNNRGVALMSKGELDRAISDFDRAVQLRTDYLGAYYNRGKALGRKGLFDRAIADYDLVIKADPKNPTFLFERGTMKANAGDQSGADADFERAESLRSNGARTTRPR
ncbi:hypothetical protein QU42_05270 [Bradyrhizobium sp. UASWS1016]|uniref:Uncharacterized protein n=3 Tax=Pseudomonadota TaxID=1224 RepID=K8PCU9_9BRAD|nr:hypothetical protein XM25_19145 [Devosia sp. H5989]EKS37430.1 hypothetical protein HMPREF9695_03848 [Afipia broomeae ATCC 49717]KIU49876.1 hypothetical protein QU41_10650 [Bradyrhizobium elkanii]KQT28413.1 hypothetical protein ASG57_17250 [Bradyrhizobium sp. Leaf396]MAH71817.1 tetratricopeptide repeat-containing protein [Afipia sp.]OCX32044.1 hypothetical protein QU42_05270 [Bradyrhizobium sp. UASWS1016]OJY08859.1 MAG: hypothetical protein BGP05_11445 [Rhizobiales bacterium 62-47]OUX59113